MEGGRKRELDRQTERQADTERETETQKQLQSTSLSVLSVCLPERQTGRL